MTKTRFLNCALLAGAALMLYAPCASAELVFVDELPHPQSWLLDLQTTQKDQDQGGAPAASGDKSKKAPVGAGQQPTRILGVMPNFRAVSAGATPPPPTPKQAFIIATRNSFDYSSFIFVGITSGLAEWSGAHKQLGTGVEGFGRYYWRGLLDKTDGNYLVIFALPTILHEDERYYALGHGNAFKRIGYAVSRVAVTPNYEGHPTINGAELLGRGLAQGVSLAYYPSATRTASAIASKYAYAILRDAATNAFREMWPDIAQHVLHRHP